MSVISRAKGWDVGGPAVSKQQAQQSARMLLFSVKSLLVTQRTPAMVPVENVSLPLTVARQVSSECSRETL